MLGFLFPRYSFRYQLYFLCRVFGSKLMWPFIVIGVALYTEEHMLPTDEAWTMFAVLFGASVLCRAMANSLNPPMTTRFKLPKKAKPLKAQRVTVAVSAPSRRASPSERVMRARLPSHIRSVMN